MGTLRDSDDLGIEPESGAEPRRVLNGIAELGLSTRYVGVRLYYLSSVGSTNVTLAEIERSGAGARGGSAGTVLIAESQLAGRGRSGRTWHSPAGGGIWTSVLFRADMPPDRLAPLSIAAAVSVAEALADLTGLDVRVKWPNDLLIGALKLGGFLAEAVRSSGGHVEMAILGAGINVNLARSELPPELSDRATSLGIELGADVSRLEVLRAVLAALEQCFDTFRGVGMRAFVDRWRARSSTLGRQIELKSHGVWARGEVVDMADSGALLVRMASGVTEEVWQGDLRLGSAADRGSDDERTTS